MTTNGCKILASFRLWWYTIDTISLRDEKRKKGEKIKIANETQKVKAKELLNELKETMRDCFVGKIEEKEEYIQLTLLSGQVFSVSVKEKK